MAMRNLVSVSVSLSVCLSLSLFLFDFALTLGFLPLCSILPPFHFLGVGPHPTIFLETATLCTGMISLKASNLYPRI